MKVTISTRPFAAFAVLVVLTGSALLAQALGRRADMIAQRRQSEPGTLTVIQSYLLGRSDSLVLDLPSIEQIDVCQGGPTSVMPAIREGRAPLFCSIMIVVRDSGTIHVGTWEPYPFQDEAHVVAVRDTLASFIRSGASGTVRASVGGFGGALTAGALALALGLLLVRFFGVTTLRMAVRAEAAGVSVITRLRRPGFLSMETEVHYVPMGWVTAVQRGPSGGILVTYSNGPDVRILLPTMSESLRVRIRLFLEDIIMTHVRTMTRD